MKYLKEFKIYNNINNFDDVYPEPIDYYQIPFSLYDNGICIEGEDDYVLCFDNHFVYDYISDVDIEKHLKKDLNDIDISTDWTNIKNHSKKFEFETAYTNKEKHELRIAKLIQEIKLGKKIRPISMFFDERAYQHDIKNYIEDGNHRIRALQYSKYDYFPAYLYGNFSKFLIDYLNKKKI
jgi:hypothetical protein